LSRHVRFFVGYSGWGQDQLSKELNERAWLISAANKRRIMDTRPDDLWGDTLRAMGAPFAPLANFPDDPSLN
jgi:putative transcriptional regulator